MTSVRFVFPKPRLNELLRSPGGLPVAEALERAQANLESIKPTCAAELMALLELCEASYWNLKDDYDEPAVTELYTLAVKGIGAGEVCGVPAVDPALTSFCDLLDHLRTLKRYDHDAVGVHVRAWRLLMTSDLPKAGADQILDGLTKVSGRYGAEVKASADAAA
ncbi:hypothetical protein [Phenylobacterium soli]|uniref:Uncharacterized protein n=1 Tax=Phenylobacterium soli TaxID=2170551 RepID=A0A328AFL5_9CAUL|nr:hypothetical protein [Phenylobacterium soli]RAK53663.1 hypothetical protein DJ017_03525 [Phenylobacterium soli]